MIKICFLVLSFPLWDTQSLKSEKRCSDNVLTKSTTFTKYCNCNTSSHALKGHKPTSLFTPIEWQ